MCIRDSPQTVRRVVTLLPALAILAAGVDPTQALVMSQVALSIGIPFAVVPLIGLSSRRSLMGEHANSRPLTVLAWAVVGLIIALNLALVWLTVTGAG